MVKEFGTIGNDSVGVVVDIEACVTDMDGRLVIGLVVAETVVVGEILLLLLPLGWILLPDAIITSHCIGWYYSGVLTMTKWKL